MDNYKVTIETWDKLADAYMAKFMYLDLYNDTYDSFCDLIKKPDSKILDIGCGPGNITKYLLAKRPDLNIEGIDTSPNMIKLAKENIPLATFKVMDCREIDKIKTTYDAIICGFCLPYLSKQDCEKFIKNSSSLLNKDGILYFSAIEDNNSKSDFETSSDGKHTIFVYYHEEVYLKQWLSENNFEFLEINRKHYQKSDGAKSTHIIFISRKK